ncbi:MAG: hypothetical protein M1821_003825 [Bathelium mastoideum]|nr:MAG: hypothetical protein M1821_003825 [Bathelium mastoideum]
MAKAGTLSTATGWTKWFPKGDLDDEIAPATAVLKEAQNFLLERLPKLGTKAKGVLTGITRHNNENSSVSTPKTDQDFLEQLNSIPLEGLSSYMRAEVDKLQGTDATWTQKRSKGLAKGAAKM